MSSLFVPQMHSIFAVRSGRVVYLTALVMLLSSICSAAEFIPLGFLEPSLARSEAYGSSADGSVVVGGVISSPGQMSVFRWTRDDGLMPLLPANPRTSVQGVVASSDGSTVIWRDEVSGTGTRVWSESFGYQTINGFRGYSISADGSLIAGSVFGADGPAIWTREAGVQILPNPISSRLGEGLFISGDKHAIAGLVEDDDEINFRKPFLWTESGGTIDLGRVPGDTAYAMSGMSDDGATVVGLSLLAQHLPTGELVTGPKSFWRWTEENGLSVLAEGTSEWTYFFEHSGRSLSSDGSVFAGSRINSDSSIAEALRWTEDTGLGVIPGLEGSSQSAIYDMSADGSVMLGVSDVGGLGFVRWLWTEATGTHALPEILAQQGLSDAIAGWDLGLKDLSDNGNAVFGTGTNPDGNSEAFVIYLDPLVIPEPSSLLLGIVTLTSLMVVRPVHCDRVS